MIDASIIVNSHNHGRYIKQCMDSLLTQVSQHSIEIIWYDDASTDDTLINGETALSQCPFPVHRLHYRNNRKKRRIPTLLDKLELCQGRYIFWIEGDDFWLRTDKVQRQIDALEAVPELNICFTPAQIFDGPTLKPGSALALHASEPCVFTLEKVITGDGGFMPTASLCIRRDVYDAAPDWLFGYVPVGDFPMQVLAAMPAGALFLPELSCAYRENVNQSWTQTVYNHPQRRLLFELEFLEMLSTMRSYLPDQARAFEKLALVHYGTLHDLALRFDDWQAHQRGGILLQRIRQG